MKWIAETLWDLVRGSTSPPPRRSKPRTAPRVSAMQERYDRLVVEMKARYGVRVLKWRTTTSGCAWEVRYRDGTTARLIEAPRPRGPMSCAVFLHEIGHHAIGFGRYRPRCLEEYHAWRWAIATMREHGLNVTPRVEKRMRDALRYAVAKAKRRGLRTVPDELLAYAGEEAASGRR